MSTKKGRGAKVLKEPQNETQKGSSKESDVESVNLSAIERASFLEGLQQNYGNPLHSTAMEEDLKVLEEGGMKEIPQTTKTSAKRRGAAAAKRKETESDGENEEEEEKKKEEQVNRGKAGRKETKKATVKGRGTPAKKRKEMERDGENEEEEEKRKRRSRRSTGGTAAGPVSRINDLMKKDKKRKSGSGESSDPESQGNCDSGPSQQRRRRVLSSEEEDEDNEDGSWVPSPKKAKLNSLTRTRWSSSEKAKPRKSSSGSASARAEKADIDEQRRKRRGGPGGTELEVVLDAFLHFCDQYRESVESNAVKQSVDSFSSNVEEQLLEKISSSRELKVLKRENTKVGSLIHKKRQKLLNAKHELMKAERQLWTLQKENTELKARLADLRRGQAFLQDIRELSRRYLDHRHKHPKEKETYGASSLPALLLETRNIQTEKHQKTNPQKD